jgi:hypothetical protein
MPDARVMVVLALVGILAVGAVKVVHGVKVVGAKAGHGIVHIIKHPVATAKDGAIKQVSKQ